MADLSEALAAEAPSGPSASVIYLFVRPSTSLLDQPQRWPSSPPQKSLAGSARSCSRPWNTTITFASKVRFPGPQFPSIPSVPECLTFSLHLVAENKLAEFKGKPGFALCLLQIAQSDGVPVDIRQSACSYFRNLVTRLWDQVRALCLCPRSLPTFPPLYYLSRGRIHSYYD